MRIISEFWDYYDIGQALGHDDRIWVRQLERIEPAPIPPFVLTGSANRHFTPDVFIDPILIAFCGRWLLAWHTHTGQPFEGIEAIGKRVIGPLDQVTLTIATPAAVESTLSRHGPSSFSRRHPRIQVLESLLNDFRKAAKTASEAISHLPPSTELLLQYQAPILAIRPSRSRLRDPVAYKNIPLHAIGLQTELHPLACYQEVQLFVDNVLTKPDGAATTTGSDEVLIAAKGFDPKYSFRTLPPGAKKLSRQRNKARKKGVALEPLPDQP